MIAKEIKEPKFTSPSSKDQEIATLKGCAFFQIRAKYGLIGKTWGKPKQ